MPMHQPDEEGIWRALMEAQVHAIKEDVGELKDCVSGVQGDVTEVKTMLVAELAKKADRSEVEKLRDQIAGAVAAVVMVLITAFIGKVFGLF
jgi:hypothetical protein